MLRILVTAIACFVVNLCFAQNQILKYDDFQTLIQGKVESVNNILKQKNYHIQPSFGNEEVRAFSLFADNDYTDILVTLGAKHNSVQLITTNAAQAEQLQKSLQNFQSKEKKGIIKYQVKNGIISHVDVKKEKFKNNSSETYTFLFEK